MPIRRTGKKLELIKEKNKKFLFKAKWNQVGRFDSKLTKMTPKKSVKTLVIVPAIVFYNTIANIYKE